MATMEVKKRVKNAVLYTNGCIRIDNVRGSYVHADKPYKGKNKRDDGKDAEPKFSIVGIMSKDTHSEAKDLIIERINEILKDNKDAKVPKDKRFIKNGDDAEKDEYVNAWTISASEINAPKCRERSGELIDRADGGERIRELFKSGYWFNILIRPWYQDNDYGKRVNAGLVGVQFVKKDQTFGEGEIDESDAWEAVEGDDGMGSGSSKSSSTADDDDGL